MADSPWLKVERSVNRLGQGVQEAVTPGPAPQGERIYSNVYANAPANVGPAQGIYFSPQQEAELAKKQAEITAKYQAIEADRAAKAQAAEALRPVPPELQGYRRFPSSR